MPEDHFPNETFLITATSQFGTVSFHIEEPREASEGAESGMRWLQVAMSRRNSFNLVWNEDESVAEGVATTIPLKISIVMTDANDKEINRWEYEIKDVTNYKQYD